MSTIQKYAPFIASALLMCGVLFLIYPHYQYYVDPDGTAYLTIAKRYANGDIQRAINGYWSPWACWLTAGLIKMGLDAIPAGVIINSLGAVGFLFISQSFFLRFDIVRKLQWLLSITLAFFLCYAVFWQSFDDLWECFFLLSILRLMLAEGFIKKPALWVICGIVGTLAYFAKAYSFPFFILNTVVCVYFLSKDNKWKWLLVSSVMIGVMVLFSLPWIYALHNKYSIWTTSTSGSLNMSWYLVGHPYWKDGIKLLLPPPYPDSPYYWEDPYFVNGNTPHFWNSWHLFGLQFLRIGLNIWKFILSSFQLSVFFIVIVGYAKWMSFWKRGAVLRKDIRVLMLSFLLFTFGYVLVNFEARYLWYMVPLSMVLGALAIQKIQGRVLRNVFIIIFPISFIAYPLAGSLKLGYSGYEEFNFAQRLENHIGESFTSNATPGIENQKIVRLAYFSGMNYYSNPSGKTEDKELLMEMRRYHIKYYFHFCDNMNHDDYHFKDENGNNFPELTADKAECIKVFIVNP